MFRWQTSDWRLGANYLCHSPAAVSKHTDGQPDLQTGEWAMTTKMEIPNASYAMPPLNYQKRISNEMMDPSQINPGGECVMLEQSVQGNSYNWYMRCTAETGIMDIKGNATYNRGSMQGDIHISSKKIRMVRHIHGHHIGPCHEQ